MKSKRYTFCDDLGKFTIPVKYLETITENQHKFDEFKVLSRKQQQAPLLVEFDIDQGYS